MFLCFFLIQSLRVALAVHFSLLAALDLEFGFVCLFVLLCSKLLSDALSMRVSKDSSGFQSCSKLQTMNNKTGLVNRAIQIYVICLWGSVPVLPRRISSFINFKSVITVRVFYHYHLCHNFLFHISLFPILYLHNLWPSKNCRGNTDEKHFSLASVLSCSHKGDPLCYARPCLYSFVKFVFFIQSKGSLLRRLEATWIQV